MPRISALTFSRRLITLFIVGIGALFLITCGGDSTTTPQDDNDTGVEPRTLSISIDVASGDPGGHIAINGIPGDV